MICKVKSTCKYYISRSGVHKVCDRNIKMAFRDLDRCICISAAVADQKDMFRLLKLQR